MLEPEWGSAQRRLSDFVVDSAKMPPSAPRAPAREARSRSSMEGVAAVEMYTTDGGAAAVAPKAW